MVADERFISWVAQLHMKKLPKTLIVKFPGEFMFPWRWWLYVKAQLPWVRARRSKLAAITLNGLLNKPEMLVKLVEGEVVMDNKSRKLIWSNRAMGDSRNQILNCYKFLKVSSDLLENRNYQLQRSTCACISFSTTASKAGSLRKNSKDC